MANFTGYSGMIQADIGVNDLNVLRAVEEIMRHDIFHSTLDWIPREDFARGAREAYEIYLLLQQPEVRKEYGLAPLPS